MLSEWTGTLPVAGPRLAQKYLFRMEVDLAWLPGGAATEPTLRARLGVGAIRRPPAGDFSLSRRA